MAKSATPRHSKNTRKPVVIDLDPAQVKRVDEPQSNPQSRTVPTDKTVPDAEPVGGSAATAHASKPEHAEISLETTTAAKSSAPVSANTESALKAGSPGSEKSTAQGMSQTASKSSARTSSIGSKSDNTMNSSAPVQKSTASLASGSILSGIAGGLIALIAAGALQWAGILPPLHNNQPDTALATQVSMLEKELDALRNQPPAQSAPMPDTQLLDRLSAAEQTADTLRSDFAKVQQQLSSMHAQDAGADNSAITAQVTALSQRLSEMESGLSDANAQSQQTAAALSGDTDALKAMQDKFTTLQQRLDAQASQPDLAPIIAVNALKAAIDRGGSYSNELKTFTALLSQDNLIAQPLAQLADSGVPTISQLSAQFSAVADKLVATEAQPSPDAGVWDQLMASVKGLVRSRPVGDVAGTGAGPVSARVEFALQNGDAQRAITEWQQYSPQAKQAGEAFYTALLARRDADALLAKLIGDTMQPQASKPDDSQPAADKSATGAN